jgi:protein-S-isoprenylcysteine O-methyltransferase Ste14
VVVAAVAALAGWGIAALDLDGSPLDNTVGLVVGVVLALAGMAVAGAGVLQFRRAATTVNPHLIHQASNVVYSGVYRFTRNPMYLGLAAVVGGWCFVLGTVVGCAVAVGIFVASISRFQIVPEERMLSDKFGVVYTQYCEHTRRWL